MLIKVKCKKKAYFFQYIRAEISKKLNGILYIKESFKIILNKYFVLDV